MEMVTLHSMHYTMSLPITSWNVHNLSKNFWYCRQKKKAHATTANVLRVGISPWFLDLKISGKSEKA